MIIEIDPMEGNYPVQAEGNIDGVPFYFRARGGHWSIGVGGDVVEDPDWFYEEDYGDGLYDVGWMTKDEARDFIVRCAAAWWQESHTKEGTGNG